jgi:hypothetical protein
MALGATSERGNGKRWRAAICASLALISGNAVAAELLGVVTSDGKPVRSRVRVNLDPVNPESRTQPQAVDSDSQGRFGFSAVTPGRYILRCPGTAPNTTAGQQVDLGPGINNINCVQ